MEPFGISEPETIGDMRTDEEKKNTMKILKLTFGSVFISMTDRGSSSRLMSMSQFIVNNIPEN